MTKGSAAVDDESAPADSDDKPLNAATDTNAGADSESGVD